MRTASGIAVVAGLCAVAIAGCGGGGKSDEDQVKEATTSYFSNLGSGKYSDACAELAASARRDVADYAAEQLPEAGSLKCSAVFEQVFELADENQLAKLKEVQVTKVTVDGTTATAVVKGATQDAKLKKIQGKWRIANLDFDIAGAAPTDAEPGLNKTDDDLTAGEDSEGGNDTTVERIRQGIKAAGFKVRDDSEVSTDPGDPRTAGALVVPLRGGAQIRILVYSDAADLAKQEAEFAPLAREMPEQFELAVGDNALYVGTVEEPATLPADEFQRVVAAGESK